MHVQGSAENPTPTRGIYVEAGVGGWGQVGGTWSLFICMSMVHKFRTGLLSLGGQMLRKAKALVPRNKPTVLTASQKAGQRAVRGKRGPPSSPPPPTPPRVTQELASASGMFLGWSTSP